MGSEIEGEVEIKVEIEVEEIVNCRGGELKIGRVGEGGEPWRWLKLEWRVI